jgi:alpha-1,2-glucosyltransferase
MSRSNLKSNDELFYLLVILPPSFFFHFLFYTDTLSTLLVMTSLLLSKQKRYYLSGLIGLLSLTLRQTNVIWIAFIAGTSILEILNEKSLLISTKETSLSLSSFCLIVLLFFKQCIYRIHRIMTHLWTFLMTMIAFSGFIMWNGGITLGDKANHIPSLHFPQLFYFSAFTCFFGLFSLGNPAELMNSIKTTLIKKWLQIALLTPAIYYLILKYT